ncbi:hypothetical protein LAJ19_20965 (plasmid) [Deinococcus taeanensis]|uniref:hypothetical protein n=1 Tax=Deinococcus taeanensis TaxID=2737050 RepID=UPI001CDD6090|nr:hypothetical protein [Deinococcus taeanensis]UBV45269.1 hypothetical protein LAJ19_20965 [Deinococcus taeanensis]
MQASPDPLSFVLLQARNDKPHGVTLVLEPWGEEVVLLSGVTVTVTVRGVRAREVELVWGERDVTLFAAPGSTVEVEDEQGVHLTEIVLPVPGLPEGMSTRAFVSQVLTGEHDT